MKDLVCQLGVSVEEALGRDRRWVFGWGGARAGTGYGDAHRWTGLTGALLLWSTVQMEGIRAQLLLLGLREQQHLLRVGDQTHSSVTGCPAVQAGQSLNPPCPASHIPERIRPPGVSASLPLSSCPLLT